MILIPLLLLLAACAPMNVAKQLSEVNSRPYAADLMPAPEYKPVVISPLARASTLKGAAIKFDSQRREYRRQAVALSTAMAAQTQATRSLKQALKAQEVESRANERMLIRTSVELKSERKKNWWSSMFHRVLEAGMAVALAAGF